jgi:hypothetical protein
MHNGECDAYELIKDLKNFPIPKVYFVERSDETHPGLIVMNDLSGKGASLGVFYTATQQQCFNIARHMADFQVYVDFMPGTPWKGKFIKSIHTQDDIEEMWKKMMNPVLEYDKGIESLLSFVE